MICVSRELEVPWSCLKRVFNVFRRKSSLGVLVVSSLGYICVRGFRRLINGGAYKPEYLEGALRNKL